MHEVQEFITAEVTMDQSFVSGRLKRFNMLLVVGVFQ